MMKNRTGKQQYDDIDHELVERAQSGDIEAFGALVEQHRNKARGWANQMTNDPFTAEDIVQEALIRALLHFRSLSNTDSFLPWLYRIVRNQANMFLRRGGQHRKEMPFSFMPSALNGESSHDGEYAEGILYRQYYESLDEAVRRKDPVERMLLKETYEMLDSHFLYLTPKERDVFRSYLFEQLHPEEIASNHSMTTGSVYTYIHRSRLKLRNESVRDSLGFITEKGGSEVRGKKCLNMPETPILSVAKNTLVDSVGMVLASIGDARTMAELMGISTFAFRFKISEYTTYSDGIYIFDWRKELERFMEELGYQITILCGQLANAPKPLLGAVERFPVVLSNEESVMPFIRKYIDAGVPILYFDTNVSKPLVHEWSVIYGYDDAERVVFLTESAYPEGKILSYSDVIHNPVRFMAGIDGVIKRAESSRQMKHSEERKQAERIIRFAVQYARHGCDYHPRTSYLRYASGIAAYDQWINHLRNPQNVPNRYGMSHLSAVYADAKRYASRYLRNIPFEKEVLRLTLLASENYSRVADEFDYLSLQVPFARDSEFLSQEMRENCAIILSQAKSYESAAIAYLDEAQSLIKKG
ncbi:RNA polymerase sigma factor [Cohnella soli]|uniref:RNA polymerase sigma factor n=1 Tax=Cohnella soli TaxID=425005 RepID=A0ABW0I5D5_9BACL